MYNQLADRAPYLQRSVWVSYKNHSSIYPARPAPTGQGRGRHIPTSAHTHTLRRHRRATWQRGTFHPDIHNAQAHTRAQEPTEGRDSVARREQTHLHRAVAQTQCSICVSARPNPSPFLNCTVHTRRVMPITLLVLSVGIHHFDMYSLYQDAKHPSRYTRRGDQGPGSWLLMVPQARCAAGCFPRGRPPVPRCCVLSLIRRRASKRSPRAPC